MYVAVELLRKLDPLIVNVCAAASTVAELGERLEIPGTGLSLLGGVTGVPPPPPPHPVATRIASRPKVIPPMDVLTFTPLLIDPAPIKFEFRSDAFAANPGVGGLPKPPIGSIEG